MGELENDQPIPDTPPVIVKRGRGRPRKGEVVIKPPKGPPKKRGPKPKNKKQTRICKSWYKPLKIKKTAFKAAVAESYLRGIRTRSALAEKFSVDPVTIYDVLLELKEEWKKAAVRDFSKAQEEELANIYLNESESWKGWFRSCEDEVIVIEEFDGVDSVDENGNPIAPKIINRVVKRKGQAGDRSFLKQALECSQERRKMLGIDAPRQVHITASSETRTELRFAGKDRLQMIEEAMQVIQQHKAKLLSGPQVINTNSEAVADSEADNENEINAEDEDLDGINALTPDDELRGSRADY